MNRWGLSICGWLLLASWLVANHYPPWVSAHSEMLAATAVAALAFAGLGRAAPRISIDGPTIFLLAIALIPLAQAATGQIFFAGDGWIAALYLTCAAWSVLWSSHAARVDRDRWVGSLAIALVAGGLLSSLVAIVQRWQVDIGPLALFIAAVPPGHAPFANLGQPNQLTSLLALGSAALLLLYERRWASGPAALAGAVLLVFAMVITQSRTGLLLFGTAILWHVMFARRLGLRTSRSVIVGLAGAWAALFAVWPRLIEVLNLSVGANSINRLQAGTRPVIWSQLWDAVWLEPWLGFGWNQVSVAQITVAADHPRSELVEHSHNLFLDLALWTGLPLALLISAAAMLWLIRSALLVRSVDGSFALLVLLLLLAHAMVEFPLDYLYFLVPFGMALGILVADTGAREVFTLSRGAGAVGLTLFVSVAGAAAIDYWHVEEAYRDMRFTVARIGQPLVTRTTPPLKTQFTQLSAFYDFALVVPRANMDRSELDGMRKVAHRFGYAPALYRYGLAQALNGDPAGARQTLLQMRQLHGAGPYSEAKEALRLVAMEHPAVGELLLP